jgi:uncharacterized protein
MTIPKLIYTHDSMARDLHSMYRTMHLEGFKPDVVVGITRGGLIPSVYVSHYFDVDLVTINVSFRDTKVLEPTTEIEELLKAGRTILLVDDICDSGETLEFIYNQLQQTVPDRLDTQMKTAVLIHNEGCQTFTPEYSGTTINKSEQDVWVCFPWEQ